jgi:WhiB family transcriptional regulator, redox-sensing transcriptional regulator
VTGNGYWRPRQDAADDIADVLAGTLLHAAAAELSWMDQARCAETDPEAFFPEKSENSRDAKRVCAECPVRAECAGYAIENFIQWGVWGGLTPRERADVRRARARQRAVAA